MIKFSLRKINRFSIPANSLASLKVYKKHARPVGDSCCLHSTGKAESARLGRQRAGKTTAGSCSAWHESCRWRGTEEWGVGTLWRYGRSSNKGALFMGKLCMRQLFHVCRSSYFCKLQESGAFCKRSVKSMATSYGYLPMEIALDFKLLYLT